MTDPRTRKAILARRAKFLAAALSATVPTMPACERDKEGIAPDHPTPTRVEPVDAAPTAKPPEKPDAAMAMPCLEVMPPATSTPDAGPPPMPCLKIAAPKDAGPAPHPCLKVAADD